MLRWRQVYREDSGEVMAFFGDGICCGTCESFESDQRGDCWCKLQGPGVSPMAGRVCREWVAAKGRTIIIPESLL